MWVKPLLVALLLLALPVGGAQAALITIDFEGFPSVFDGGPDFSAGVEDGVSITATGDDPEILQFFPPDTNRFAMGNRSLGTTTWTFTRVGGGLFTFDAFDLRYLDFGFGTSAVVATQGFLSGVSQGADIYLTPVSWRTFDPVQLLGVPVDTLVITLINQGGFANMDDIVLSVPEPTALALLGLGLLGAAASARRSRPCRRAGTSGGRR